MAADPGRLPAPPIPAPARPARPGSGTPGRAPRRETAHGTCRPGPPHRPPDAAAPAPCALEHADAPRAHYTSAAIRPGRFRTGLQFDVKQPGRIGGQRSTLSAAPGRWSRRRRSLRRPRPDSAPDRPASRRGKTRPGLSVRHRKVWTQVPSCPALLIPFSSGIIAASVPNQEDRQWQAGAVAALARHKAGCCCVRQCSVPSPHTRSTAWIPTTARPGNSSASVFSARRSLASLNVGTSTRSLAM